MNKQMRNDMTVTVNEFLQEIGLDPCDASIGENLGWEIDHGYYSDDNFATYGTTFFESAQSISWDYIANENSGCIAPVLYKYDDGIYFITDDTSGGICTQTLWKSFDGGATFSKHWEKVLDSADDFGSPERSGFFIYNGFLYIVSSNDSNNTYVLKFRLSDGQYISKVGPYGISYTAGSDVVGFYGFIKGGIFYGGIATSSATTDFKLNLDTMESSPWYPVTGFDHPVAFDSNAADLITKDGKYWIIVGNRTRGTYDSPQYGGIVVHSISTGKGFYITDGMVMQTSSGSSILGCPFEDGNGDVIIPQGGRNNSKATKDCRLNKLDLSKIKLPSIEFAYLKARELTT